VTVGAIWVHHPQGIMYGTRTRRVKTDKRDARALADACASGTYREAHRASESRRQVKVRLGVRDALVRHRAKHLVLMGTLVRQQGLRVPTGQAKHFLTRLKKVDLPATLTATLAPLVTVVELLNFRNREGGGRRRVAGDD
jgi:hypothetical protein